MDVRLHQPIEAMREAGAEVFYFEKKVVVPEGVDLVVIQRMIASQRQWDDLVEKVEQRGALLVTEWDDHPEKFPAKIRARFGSDPLVHVLSGHAVQTSTDTLASFFSRDHPEVEYFSNHLRRLPPRAPKSREQPRIFFGALNREQDWAPILEPINRALKAHPQLHAIVVHDRSFFDALQSTNKSFFPAQSYASYSELMQACDLVLMPLEDRIENHCKSDIKFVEAAAGAATVIASPIVYAKTLKHRSTGWIAEQAAEWFEAIDYLIVHDQYRAEIGETARAYVARERMLSMHIHKRLAWYRRLVEQRASLIDSRRSIRSKKRSNFRDL